MPAGLTPGDFAGVWQLERSITDRLSGQASRFSGQAQFAPRPPQGLDYHESGLLHLGDAVPLVATRRYLWDFVAGKVAVRFADGQPFHDFAPGTTGEGSLHLCGGDTYRVAYDFDQWPAWRVRWQVLGPRKDYAMTSQYQRDMGTTIRGTAIRGTAI